MIDPRDWKWCGFPGHFIAARWCRFHLTTRVGDFIISTVGDYRPCYGGHEQDTLGADPDDLYETMVSPVASEGECPVGAAKTWEPELQERFATSEAAEQRHMELCWLYAAKQ